MSDTGAKSLSLRTVAIAIGVAVLGAFIAFWINSGIEKANRNKLTTEYGATVEKDPESGDLTIAFENESLTDLLQVGKLLNRSGRVTVLDLSGCNVLTTTSGVEAVADLESVIGIGLPNLKSLKGIDQLPNLRELVFVECAALEDISAVSQCHDLSALDLSGATSLTGEVHMTGLLYLTDLTLSQCEAMERLVLGATPLLRSLYVDGCSRLKSIDGLSAPQLTDIDCSNTHSLNSTAFLGDLPALQLVDLRNCAATDVISVVGKCETLKILRLGGLTNVTDFQALSALKALTEFHLDSSTSLTSLDGLPTSELLYCGITQCPELTSISALANAKKLHQLDVSGGTRLTDLSPLTDLPDLQDANLTGCRAIRDIAVFTTTPSIAVIQVGGTSVPRTQIGDLQKLLRETIIDFSGG